MVASPLVSFEGRAGGVLVPKRALDRWKQRSKPALTTLTGAVVAGTVAFPVSSFDGFPSDRKFRAYIGTEEVAVTAGFGTLNWTVTRGLNGTVAAGYAAGTKITSDAIFRVAILGDSTAQGFQDAALDPWSARLARALSRVLGTPNLSPQLGSGGFYPVFRSNDANITNGGNPAGNSDPVWTALGGAWTTVGAGIAQDRGPYGWSVTANGAANVLGFVPPAVLGDILCVDLMYGNSILNGFSTSIDGGATWQNAPGSGSAPGGGRVCRARITSGAPITDLRVRAANAAGAATTPFIIGVDCWNTAPVLGTDRGVRVWNVGMDSQFLSGLNHANAAGDNFGFLDLTNSDFGCIAPDLLIVGPFTNDVILGNWSAGAPATYLANLNAVIARCKPQSDIIVHAFCEQSGRSVADQQTLRNQVHAAAIANNVAYLDLYDAFAAEGLTGYAACNADGLMGPGPDPNHMGNLGQIEQTDRLFRMLNEF